MSAFGRLSLRSSHFEKLSIIIVSHFLWSIITSQCFPDNIVLISVQPFAYSFLISAKHRANNCRADLLTLCATGYPWHSLGTRRYLKVNTEISDACVFIRWFIDMSKENHTGPFTVTDIWCDVTDCGWIGREVWPSLTSFINPLSLSFFSLVMSNQINWAERCDKEGAPWGAMLLPPSLSPPPPYTPPPPPSSIFAAGGDDGFSMHRAELSAPLHLDSPHQHTQKPQLTSNTRVYAQQHCWCLGMVFHHHQNKNKHSHTRSQ